MTGFVRGPERVIHEGAKLTLVVGSFTDPDGERFEREIVHLHDAVAIVAVLDDGASVVLVRQYRAPIDTELLELPAGKLDIDGEDPEDAAARELEEEVGRRPGPSGLEELARFWNSAGTTDEETIVYLARELAEGQLDLQGVEERHMTTEVVALAEVPALVADGRLRDPKTIVGLLMARERLGLA